MAEDRASPGAPRISRRRFALVAGAAAAGVGTGLTLPWGPPRHPPEYLGARKIAGPAARGVPLIGIRVNEAGELEGIPQVASSPVPHSLSWYSYCSRAAAPGLEEGFTSDNVLRYHEDATKLASYERDFGKPLWYADKVDQAVRAEHFSEVGMGAPFRWRSEGQQDTNVLTGLVLRVDVAAMRGTPPGGFADSGFLGYATACTHFCCTAGYRQSKIAKERGRFDTLFCTCHDSVFDPLYIKRFDWPPTD